VDCWRERNAKLGGSLCDAIVTPSPGLLPWELMQNRLTAGLAVSDAEALAAVRWAAQELKLVLEPGGAVALAALLSGKLELAGRTALVMLSGGNIDPALLQSVLNA
jgi:threonine dehydratase